jgi:4-amino-4-deoxy-L-arabinose transferase-like glycosyltransferase
VFALILLIAGIFRFTGLNWDRAQWIHPDEGHMRAVTGAIHWPETLDAYFDTHASTLNPRNNEQIYSYGTLPLFATRAVAEWLDRGCGATTEILPRWIAQGVLQHLNHPQPPVAGWRCYPGTFTWTYNAYIGRHLAALADMGTLIVIGLVARQLYTRRLSLLAMALTAVTAFMIQQAHFYTVDSAATFFTVLTAYFAIRAGLTSTTAAPPWASLALAGFSTGLAAACKVSAALAAGLVALGALAWVHRRLRAGVVSAAAPSPHVTSSRLSGRAITSAGLRCTAASLRVAPAVLLAALLSLLAFRIAQPYAFEGPGFFGIQPSPEWLGRLSQISEEQSGSIDYPSGRQWTNRLPVLFPWLNIVVWGMGLPLGCAAWAGWALMGIELARGDRRHLILWVWTTAFFAFYATRWVKAMRYFLPIYPFLILMAAYALSRLIATGQTAGLRRQGAREQEGRPQDLPYRIVRWVAIGAALAVMLGTVAWGTGLFSIYTRPHTRIAASSWVYANIPDGSVVANEHWDWGLPLRIEGQDGFRATGVGPTFTGFTMEHYNEDTPEKRAHLITWLDQADYLFLASNRLYGSIPRLPERYPMTTEYYRALFSGELGFELAAQFTSYIKLGPFTFPDQEIPFAIMTPGWSAQSATFPLALMSAEESFSVYDHPDCLIFRKTAEYNHERTATLLNAVNLDDAQPWQTPQEVTPRAVHRAHTVAFYGLLMLTAVVALTGLVRPETNKE